MTQAETSQDLCLKGGKGLAAEVIDKGLCSVCGACVGHCPYFAQHEGRVILLDRCTLGEGRCYEFCPMAGAKGDFPDDLGQVKDIFVARAIRSEYRKQAQYGGVVSALLGMALKHKLIEEAVVTSGEPERAPYGVRARTKAQVLASAGTRFSASGVLAALNQALYEPSTHPLAVVGVPCQIKAAAAMRSSDRTDFDPKRISFLIGLFCTWALDYRQLSKYLRYMLMGERARRYDIPPPPKDIFKVHTGNGILGFPLEEIRPMALKACGYCDDMTAAMADISVGALEGEEGWNTVIVRTEAGQQLIDLARKRKLLHFEKLPGEDLEHLKTSAAIKKERGRKAWDG